MKSRKKLPIWVIAIIDLCVIAVYVGGFYLAYYKVPRQLASTVTVAEAATIAEDTSANQETTVGSNSDNTSSENSSDTEDYSTSNNTSDTSVEALKEKFSAYFTDTVVSTASSYSSDDISINVQKYTDGTGENIVTYYVADIYIADITSLQSGFAEDTYGIGYTDTVLSMDESLSAILAINGDYYGNGQNGVVIRNGEVYRTATNGCDVCVLYKDGTMKTYSSEEFDEDKVIADGAWQAWCFGPELLDESGNTLTQFTTDNHISQINPRSAIGYYEPGHYCLVVVDGRQSGYSNGMTLTELSSLFEKLGCQAAYNLDGGKSSAMTFNDTEVNQPCDGGREVSDCIVIKEVN